MDMETMGRNRERTVGDILIIATGIMFVVSLYTIFHYAPTEAALGFAQKIFYFHLPSAILGYLGFGICFVASVVYLIRPSDRADAVARAGASTGVLFCAMVLISGPLWARKSWGTFWTGEPRLVLTLALFMIFLSYVLVRSYAPDGPLVRKISAVLAIFGFADIPLVRTAVERWGGNHPQVVTGSGGGISSEMELALTLSFVAFIMLFTVLFWVRLRAEILSVELMDVSRQIRDRELLLEDEVR